MSPPIEGKRFLLAGRFSALTQDQYKERLRARGAPMARSLSGQVDYLVAGQKVKPARLETARKLEIEVVDEATLLPWVGIDDFNTRLERLRDLLASPPSEEVWTQLRAALDNWPDGELDQALDYAEAHLAEWPRRLRPAPERWVLRGRWARDRRLAVARVASPEAERPLHLYKVEEVLGQRRGEQLIERLRHGGERRRLKRSSERLRLLDGFDILAETTMPAPPDRLYGECWLLDGDRVWFQGHTSPETASLWLLAASDLSILDRYDFDLMISEPDIGLGASGHLWLNCNAGDSHVGVYFFTRQEDRIEVAAPPLSVYDSFEFCGIDLEGRVAVGLDGDGLVHLRPLQSATPTTELFPVPSSLEGSDQGAVATWGARLCGHLLVVPLMRHVNYAPWEAAVGLAVVDVLEERPLGYAPLPLPLSEVYLEVINDEHAVAFDQRGGHRTQLYRLLWRPELIPD